MSLTFCNGENCPLREKCLRYKEDIDKKEDQHFDFAPWKDEKMWCGFYIGIDGRNIFFAIDELKNENRHTL